MGRVLTIAKDQSPTNLFNGGRMTARGSGGGGGGGFTWEHLSRDESSTQGAPNNKSQVNVGIGKHKA